MPITAMPTSAVIHFEAEKILFLRIINSFCCSAVGGPPCFAIASLILLMRAAACLFIVKPMMNAMNAIPAPVVSVRAYQLWNHIGSKPPDNFQINKNPASIVMIADTIAATGYPDLPRFCINFAPSGPDAFNVGMRKNVKKNTLPAQKIPNTM